MPELPSAGPGPRLQRPTVQAGRRALKGSGAGSRDTAAPRRGYRARVPLASTKGPSPQPLGLPPTPDAPQGWAEGRTGIRSRLLLGSLCLPPWRATTVASGGLCSPVPLGGPRDKGPQRNRVPLPRPTRCLQGCFWKFLEPKVSVGSAHSQAAHQRPVFTVWASGTPPGSWIGQCLCRNHVQQAQPPTTSALSCCTTAQGPFQNQPPPGYGGEAPILAAPSPRPGVPARLEGHACRYRPKPHPGRHPEAQAWGWVSEQGSLAEEGGQRMGGSSRCSLHLLPGPLPGSRRPPWPAMETQQASAHPGCIHPAPER